MTSGEPSGNYNPNAVIITLEDATHNLSFVCWNVNPSGPQNFLIGTLANGEITSAVSLAKCNNFRK